MDDRVSACRKVEMAGVRCKRRNRKNWKKCVDDGLLIELVHDFMHLRVSLFERCIHV